MNRLGSGAPMSEFVSFRVDCTLFTSIAARGAKAGPVARRDLDRYYRLLRDLLPHIRLNALEARALHAAGTLALDANGTNEVSAYRLLWIATAERSGDQDFVARVRGLGPATTRALIDAFERYRLALDHGGEDSDELLAALGLI